MTFIDGAKITKRHNGAGWFAVTVQTTGKYLAAARKCSVRERLPSRRADGSLAVPYCGTVEAEASLAG